MRLKLTLLRPGGTTDDILVTAEPNATLGDIARAIAEKDPQRPAGTATDDPPETESSGAAQTLRIHRPGAAEAELLSPSRVIGEAHIGSGLAVSVADLDASRGQIAFGDVDLVADLRVVSGPAQGEAFLVASGSLIIGRDSSCDIVLHDSMVSKRHARIEVEPGMVTFVDLNSANGLTVDGGIVARVSFVAGGRLTLGESVIEVVTVGKPKADAGPRERAGAPRAFNRSPRREERFPGLELTAPASPVEEFGQGLPWLVMIAPLLIGVVLYVVTQSILSVVFVALSPILLLGNYFNSKSERKRKLKRAIARFRSQFADLEATLLDGEENERRVRLQETPALADVVRGAQSRERMLWVRRPEHWSFLTLRLGIGRLPSRSHVEKRSANDASLPEYDALVDELVDRFEYIDGVPAIESLPIAGGLGVAGSRDESIGYASSLIVQATALHSPAELVVTALIDPRVTVDLDWIKWLPHATSPQSPVAAWPLADSVPAGLRLLSALEEIVQTRSSTQAGVTGATLHAIDFEDSTSGIAKTSGLGRDKDTPVPLPVILVVVAGDVPADRGRLIQLLERGADVGVYPIWVAPTAADLPGICRTFVEVDPTGTRATVSYVREGVCLTDVAVQVIDPAQAAQFARSLAPVTDSGSYSADESDLPRSVSFVQILGNELAHTPGAVVDRWLQNESMHDRTTGLPPFTARRNAGTLRALIGQGSPDAMHLDLRTQGPHALVGGTTGSGKSEFLQAWVLGMAAEYSPDRVTFLFIDYKGGSAFAECVHLPHCVGLVTDLSPHLVRRALTSLRAEIHFRERLFNKKGVKDLIELEKQGDPECPPALVLVIDEFAALAGEVPEFVDGVVAIGQRGRSLGIPLILATQRPAGVIKDNLRANTNLRVALRMADEADSTDVIGSSIAAGFDPSLPGRAVVKMGPGRLTPFQSGYAGGWTAGVQPRARVDVTDLGFGQARVWESPAGSTETEADESGPNDSARLVANIAAAFETASLPAPRKPWLDELAPVYDLAKLHQRTDSELLLGVADDPANQKQHPIYFRPDTDGNVAIYGAGASGKTVALRTLAAAAGVTPKGGPVVVYALDFTAGGLRVLEELPHVGSVIDGDDSERIVRLFGMLRSIADERIERYARARASTITEYRALTGETEEQRILLLVDGMAAFRQDYEYTGAANIFTAFQQLLSDGRQVGIHAAVTADRPGSVSPAVAASIQRRVVLRLADDNDYAMLDVGTDVLTAASPPGRAVIDGLVTQIAVLGGTPNVALQAKAIEGLAETLRYGGRVTADPIERLTDSVLLSDLGYSVPNRIPLGISDDTLKPVGIDPSGVFMISGPPSSGRTSLLLALLSSVASAAPHNRLVYFGNARSPLAQLGNWFRTATTTEDSIALARDLLAAVSEPQTTGNSYSIVIESMSDYLGTGVDTELIPLIKAARRNSHFVIAESETSTWTQSWPLTNELRSGRRGFALQPDQHEGDLLFKTTFPRVKRNEFPPGRGWFVEAGRVRKVQTAQAD